MASRVDFTDLFNRAFDRLGRKYPSVFKEIEDLIEDLEQDKRPGDQIPNLDYEVYKVRLPNRSANKGKSGGFRVIYYLQTADMIVMLSLYVKNEQTDIPITTITGLIEEFLSNQADSDPE